MKLPPLPAPDEGWMDPLAWNEQQMQSYGLACAKAALEAAAVAAWSEGMDTHNKAKGLPCDAREVGGYCARAIRKLMESIK